MEFILFEDVRLFSVIHKTDVHKTDEENFLYVENFVFEEYPELQIFKEFDTEIFNVFTSVTKSGIYAKEIGCQKRGDNQKFFKQWGGTCVIEYCLLLQHWDEYFSKTSKDRQYFKENIVDKFIEGKTFVFYD